jgi:hypothetical protein
VTDPSQVQLASGSLENTGTTGNTGTNDTGTTGNTGTGETGTTGNTGAETPNTSSVNMPVSYRDATNTLGWNGFTIYGATCSVTSGPDGFEGATVSGSATVPTEPSDSVVTGEVEAWILNSSGEVIASGKPWALPQSAGTYRWTVGGFFGGSASASACLVQGIDPAFPYNVPQ